MIYLDDSLDAILLRGSQSIPSRLPLFSECLLLLPNSSLFLVFPLALVLSLLLCVADL